MNLTKNQYVLFKNGRKEGYLEARWSDKHQAFFTFMDDDEKIWSTTVIDKPKRKKSERKFEPSEKTCPIRIYPCGQNDKCYIVEDGVYGRSKGGYPSRVAYKYIAKSICYANEQGEIFKPIWA